MDLRTNIPKGKTRVIGVDLFSNESYLMGDYDTPGEAFRLADEHNGQRSGEMDDVFYVYDDTGNFIRGEKAVEHLTGNLGVSP